MGKEPSMDFDYKNGKTVRATPRNTTIYRFHGRLYVYDHIFCVVDATKKEGIYLFRHQPGYEQAANHMMDNDYPAMINLRRISSSVVEAFHDIVRIDALADVEKGIPREWKP